MSAPVPHICFVSLLVLLYYSMHLLTFVHMKDPNLFLRASVIVGQVSPFPSSRICSSTALLLTCC